MKVIKYFFIGCLIGTLCSCGDFLEGASQDEVRPSTLEDLKQLMLYEAYPRNTWFCQHLDFLTDDIESLYPKREDHKAFLNDLAPVFKWEVDMDELVKMNYWEIYYKRIKGCNVVLDMLDKMDGSESERENLKGQALALRAYYYLMLVNLYGQPYNAPGIDRSVSLGVPLILKSSVEDNYPERNTLAEVYEQIERDLLKSLPLLEAHGTANGVYRVTDLFTNAVLSRLYLYQERWDKASEYANNVLKKRKDLVHLANLVTESWGTISFDFKKNVYDANSIENIWSYSSLGEYSTIFLTAGWDFPPAYLVSGELYGLYEYDAENTSNLGDLRVQFFYVHCGISLNLATGKAVTRPYHGRKGNPTIAWYTNKGIRVSEMFLNRAEANIRLVLAGKGDDELLTSAIDDLNTIRESRYDTRNEPYHPVTEFKDAQAVLDFCLKERRRELSFEDHRWFDLRRYGMPELTHTITLSEGSPETYQLSKGDKRYVLQIPKATIDRNYKLEQNPR